MDLVFFFKGCVLRKLHAPPERCYQWLGGVPGTEGKLRRCFLIEKEIAGWALLPRDSVGPEGVVARPAGRCGKTLGRECGCPWETVEALLGRRPVFCWDELLWKNGGREKGPQRKFWVQRPRTLVSEPGAVMGHGWVQAILVW